VAVNRKFTRIPKMSDLITQGVPTEVIPTYCALADHTNNKTGLCWPKMETLAQILNRSVRTVQRHLHLLRSLGLIEFVNRRRWKGRFSSYTYKVLHIVTTGHTRPVDRGSLYKRRTKQSVNSQKSQADYQDYAFFFGDSETSKQADQYKEQYAWFFQE
jgi:DNA-binding transcriptional MocR family regulator